MKSNQDQHSPMHQAVGFLARRDHSILELSQKLLNKGHSQETIDQVLQDLQNRGYLDDRRYAQMMIRHHYLRGQGPQKIRFLLSQKGVSNAIISESLEAFDEDWFALAKDIRQKRFGDKFKSNEKSEIFKEKSKQMRFLMTRGFEADHIQYALDKID